VKDGGIGDLMRSTTGRVILAHQIPEISSRTIELWCKHNGMRPSRNFGQRLTKIEQRGFDDVVAGINSGEIAAKFYFDKESGYLLRILRYTKSPLGRNPTQIDYADFHMLNGLKVPFRKTIARPNSRLTVQIEDAEFNVPVDEKNFVRLAVAPTPTQPSS